MAHLWGEWHSHVAWKEGQPGFQNRWRWEGSPSSPKTEASLTWKKSPPRMYAIRQGVWWPKPHMKVRPISLAALWHHSAVSQAFRRTQWSRGWMKVRRKGIKRSHRHKKAQMFQTATIWNICQGSHRRYRFTGEAERFVCWLRLKREQPKPKRGRPSENLIREANNWIEHFSLLFIVN